MTPIIEKYFHNALFNVYTGLYYFKKTKRVANFFALLETGPRLERFPRSFCKDLKSSMLV